MYKNTKSMVVKIVLITKKLRDIDPLLKFSHIYKMNRNSFHKTGTKLTSYPIPLQYPVVQSGIYSICACAKFFQFSENIFSVHFWYIFWYLCHIMILKEWSQSMASVVSVPFLKLSPTLLGLFRLSLT